MRFLLKLLYIFYKLHLMLMILFPLVYVFNVFFHPFFQFSIDHHTNPQTNHLPPHLTLQISSGRGPEHYSNCRPLLGPVECPSRHATASAIPWWKHRRWPFAHVSNRFVHRLCCNGGQIKRRNRQTNSYWSTCQSWPVPTVKLYQLGERRSTQIFP